MTKERKDVKINKTREKDNEINAVLMEAHILIARKTNRSAHWRSARVQACGHAKRKVAIYHCNHPHVWPTLF
jgi:hypothetical protein